MQPEALDLTNDLGTMTLDDNAEASRRLPAAERARKSARYEPLEFLDIKSMVTLLIGDGAKPIEVLLHKEVACHRSPVLRAAFSGEFLEGQDGTYKLEHISEGTARLLVQWMYTQTLVVPHLKDDVPKVRGLWEGVEDMGHLVNLWTLADELQMPALQNDAMTTIQALQRKIKTYPLPLYSNVYRDTAKGSLLRLFFADSLSINIFDSHRIEVWEPYIPKEMMMDMIISMSKRLAGTKDNEFRLEDYFVVVPTAEEVSQQDFFTQAEMDQSPELFQARA